MRFMRLSVALALSLSALAVSAARDPNQDDDGAQCTQVLLPNGNVLETCVLADGSTTQVIRARGSSGGF